MKDDARFEALDAWRGICAVLIVIFHFTSVVPSALAHALFLRNAYLFVDFFFVLSGFVLCHTYRGRICGIGDLGRFVLRRFARVWPLHAVVLGSLLFSIGVVAFLPHPASLDLTWSGDTYSIYAIVPTLLLLNAMNVTSTAVWNGPAWSIGAEFYTYLLFALLLIFASRRLVGMSVAISAVALAVVFWKAPDLMNTTYDYGAIRCLAGFFGGVAAYQCFERRGSPGLGVATAQEIAALALVVGFVIRAGGGPDSVHPSSLAAPLVFAVAVVIFAGEGGLLSAMLRTRPLKALGRYSFSIYMVHQPLLVSLCYAAWLAGDDTTKAFGGSAGRPWGSSADVLLVDFILAVILLSAAVCRFIEVPARNYLNRLADLPFVRRHAAA
ncbi:MAG: hypothetical protein OJF62_003170 [Pseudolabrys sp.]|jgi:peptidoglycan/LPS O-acetylase OafA/YrhL|nr:hypothetical protein [Pseudolabrys sp.]